MNARGFGNNTRSRHAAVTMAPMPDVELDDLTSAQREAVLHESGPLLVVAGPGSGKTRVITRRIAHLVSLGYHPDSILALTFTNKAAEEMRRRVERLAGGTYPWIRTFHSACAAMLRRWPRAAGLKPGFSIFDTSDQKRVVRQAMKDLDYEAGMLRPPVALAAISGWKTEGLRPAEALEAADGYIGEVKAKVYGAYEAALQESNAVDFDDLLVRMLRAMDEDADLRRRLQYRFEHVLIDEYQDTSPVQFRLAAYWAERTRNLCATGDPDQSIYRFRKADIRNILEFEQRFPDAKVVRLERNFRSVGNVLQAADAVIANNRQRHAKRLITDREDGPLITVCGTSNEHDEGREIVQAVLAAYQRGVPYQDVAVFYRTNAQSRAIEAAFRRVGVPYTIVKGVEFFQRAEVKDLIAYLKVLANPSDWESLVRVLSTPAKGIGAKSLERVRAIVRAADVPARHALRQAAAEAKLTKKATLALRAVDDLLTTLQPLTDGSVGHLVRRVIDLVDYRAYLRQKYDTDAQERVENVEELVASAEDYDERSSGEGGLAEFLTEVGLVSDVDSFDPEVARVPLMTLHSAKGLEFREVIIAGLEQGLLPHSRSIDSDADLEEERRLFFVGLTRAKERVTLTYAMDRRAGIGSEGESDFLRELPEELLDVRGPGIGSVRRADDDYDPWRGAGSLSTRGRRRWGRGRDVRDPTDTYGIDVAPDQDEHGEFEELVVGAHVLHDQFGRGRIRRLSGQGASRKALIQFEQGERTLALSFARLTVLEE